MSKTIVFNDFGYPAIVQAGPPPNHVVAPDNLPIMDNDGRVLAHDLSYRWHLLGRLCYGGLDGRTATQVPEDMNLVGKSWDDLAKIKNDSHPYGYLKQPRPETTAEKRAREEVEAQASTLKKQEEIKSIIVSDRQFAQAITQLEWITREEAIAFVTTGELPRTLHDTLSKLDEDNRFAIEIKLRGTTEFHRAAAETDIIGGLFGKSPAELDQAFVLANTL